MGFTVLIPARLGSTRLPNKPLVDIAGKPMVVRVALRARASSAQRVTVAADDMRIVRACHEHGVEALLTRTDHGSGSDRLAEACDQLGLNADEVVVNVQGDEPLIDPNLIDAVAQLIENAGVDGPRMSTAAHAIGDFSEFVSPNVVKVCTDANGHALYFSRAPIPWWRDGYASNARSDGRILAAEPAPLRHVGIYAYRAGFLRHFTRLPPAPIELLEALEQLRALWHGHRIAVHVSQTAPGAGVDTPEDLDRVRAVFESAAT